MFIQVYYNHLGFLNLPASQLLSSRGLTRFLIKCVPHTVPFMFKLMHHLKKNTPLTTNFKTLPGILQENIFENLVCL